MNDQSQYEVAVFNTARRLPAGERAAYLDKTCAGDTALRQRVQELLLAAEEAGNFLEKPAQGAELLSLAVTATRPGGVNAPAPPAEKPGDWIGRYKLLEQIGEGGCGVVYMAEQEEPVRRKVALKVIKLGMDTKNVIARFEAERQALALMDHPNIAKVLDAGATETGRPYFVMELVRGVKITEYCDEHNLSARQRLDLFIQVCRAIQHAHQKGIIHRDIKPSNILVTLHDGQPMPMVIDFGIAKATGGLRLTDRTVFTAFEQFLGTPAYMSPEQAQLTNQDIDTRSDIYSLGVLLYELLTSKTPFETKELLQVGLEAMLRILREKEPVRPSTRLSTMLNEELTATARHRQTEAPKLIQLLNGDLDWIVMKSLEKNRSERYETANGLAMDLQRHLNNEPILARPPGKLYRFRQFVRRNKVMVASASAVIAALIIGLGLSTWSLFKEKVARERAVAAEHAAQEAQAKTQIEAIKSQQVAGFLQEMLKGVGPSVALGRDTTLLREIVDQTAERVGKELTNQLDVQSELLNTMGLVYRQIGDFDKAAEVDQAALTFRKKAFGENHPAVATSYHNLALDASFKGQGREAEMLMRCALALRRKLLGEVHPDVAESFYRLSRIVVHEVSIPAVNIDSRRLGEAEGLAREALAIKRKIADHDDWELATFLAHLAELLQQEAQTAPAKGEAKMQEAESLDREALAIMHKRRGHEQPDGYVTMFYIADVLLGRGKFAEAESAFQEAMGILRRLWGNEASRTTTTCTIIVRKLCEQGALTESLSVFHDQLALTRTNQQFAEETIGQVTAALEATGHHDQAEQFCLGVLSLELPSQSSAIPTARGSLVRGRARAFAHAGRWRETIAEVGKLPEAETQQEMELYVLATLLVASGDAEQYQRHRQRMIKLFGDTQDPDIAGRMAKCSLIVPSPDADWQVVAKWAQTAVSSELPPNQLPYRQFTKGLAEYRQGYHSSAVGWLQKALKSGETINCDDCEVQTRMVLAMAHCQLKQTDEARTELAKGIEIAEKKLPKLASGDLGENWFEWIIAQTLLHEAKTLITGKSDTSR